MDQDPIFQMLSLPYLCGMVRRRKARAIPALSSVSSTERASNVILVDDDSLVRTALARLLRGAGYRVSAFERASDVLLAPLPTNDTCLMLDVYMPELSGIGLWHELYRRGCRLPTVLITGQRNQQVNSYGEQVGAVAILYTPIEETQLFAAIEMALKWSPD